MKLSSRVVPGMVSGLVGSLCCMIGAIAVGLGLMASWLGWSPRRERASAGAPGWGRADLCAVARTLVPQLAVMGGVYGATLLVTAMVSSMVVRS